MPMTPPPPPPPPSTEPTAADSLEAHGIDSNMLAASNYIADSIMSLQDDMRRILPAGRPLSMTLTKLDEAMLWAASGLVVE